MWQSRQNIVKLSGLLLASLLAWYMGYLFAGLLSEDSMSTPITYLQDIGKKPVLKAPVPKRQKCDHWSPCLPGNYAYRVRSGGGRENLAKICFEDELIISEEKGNVGRGINIAIVNYKTGKMISAKFFDMWEGEHSAEMATFIKNAPQGSLLLMVTHDDGSTRLKSDAKTLIEALGSKEIQNMKFRSSWAFIAAKGFKLPDDIQTEKSHPLIPGLNLPDIVKLSGLLLASLLAWYMGYLFAGLLSEDSMSTPITYLQDIGKKPVLKAPVPKRQKCDHWSPCLPGNYAYRVRSGGGRENLAKICFEDELIISEEKGNVGRGINIAIVNYKTGKMISAKFFDMWEGEHSAEMATFIKNAPQGSLLLMVTHDDGSTRLKSDAKTLIEALGSKEIQNMKFRSSWAFIAAKGFKLPDDIQTEKINHSDNKKNRYSGWPAEIVIEGCIPRNLI